MNSYSLTLAAFLFVSACGPNARPQLRAPRWANEPPTVEITADAYGRWDVAVQYRPADCIANPTGRPTPAWCGHVEPVRYAFSGMHDTHTVEIRPGEELGEIAIRDAPDDRTACGRRFEGSVRAVRTSGNGTAMPIPYRRDRTDGTCPGATVFRPGLTPH